MGPFINKILIVGITPYFLEKEVLWFEQNIDKILEARKTQSFFEDNTLYIESGQTLNLSQFLRKLDEMGYEKVLQVQEPGELSQRGGIADVFPVNLNYAVRFEFLGNEIDSIQLLGVDEKKLYPPEFHEMKFRRARELLKKKLKSQKIFSELKGLKPGDYLVHLDHGIARFCGIGNFPSFAKASTFANASADKSEGKQIPKTQDYYILNYAAGDKLYVPLGLERKLSRYVGFIEPKISRLGSSLWQRTKRKIKEEAEKLAKELLEIYAKRNVATRVPYLPDDEIDSEIADTFKHEETLDQIQAIEEIKKDLEKNKPMDRLVCGDVGFGKTEVALRAAIKVVKSGFQAVIIAPTTILANQHFESVKERFKGLAVNIAILSRLQTKKEQKETIEKLKNGKVDILIGTHRLLSRDVTPLLFSAGQGLLVIDDEQRFGVKQKEKLKQLRSRLDILSLSATPIPRTLYLSLSSLRDISLIQTPPVGRRKVETFIVLKNNKIIKKAIAREISRGGQVYYPHNRIATLEAAKNSLQKLAPKAKIAIIHAKIKERELIKTMKDFRAKKIDVLMATTIIENGLDIPNVNTLIAADAGRLGLAQAYQIQGRIGRSNIQAFAYFLRGKRLSEKAKLRLAFLKEAAGLGSGYLVALRDLEIRGAGNILGKEQSGNINKVGLNLYCQLISESVERLKIAKPAP